MRFAVVVNNKKRGTSKKANLINRGDSLFIFVKNVSI